MPRIAPLAEPDLETGIGVLRRAGFGAAVGQLVGFPLRSCAGKVLAARDGAAFAGIACCVSFGASGWIGALAVAPEARRRGIGTALTAACIDWLRERGASTVSLYATPDGRAVYERMGFVAEGASTAWSGTGGVRRDVALRRLAESDRSAIAALDTAALGENRTVVLDALRPLNGLGAVRRDGGLVGFCAASPWGSGAAIVAEEPAAGVALMAASSSDPGPGTIIVPDANGAAGDALRHWGFHRYNSAERMRIGPPLDWHAKSQFGQFNLFWG